MGREAAGQVWPVAVSQLAAAEREKQSLARQALARRPRPVR